jgi:hypothetical protein
MSNDYSKIIAEQYSGILPFHEAFYIRSIGVAAQKGAEEFENYRTRIRSKDEVLRAIHDLQTALTHAAIVSRFFWPASRDLLTVTRAARLRLGYNLNDSDPLADRALRNAIEHFDERLDKFLARSPTGPIVDMVIGDHSIADDPLGYVLRLVDSEAEIFVLLGKKFRFVGVEMSLRSISNLSVAMAKKGYRLPVAHET